MGREDVSSGNNMQPDYLGIWERIAPYWDDFVGDDGNQFQQTLIMPATDELLALQPGETVLDVACGNGNYSRRMAAAGAIVTGFDGAPHFIERARERTKSAGLNVDYFVQDATDEAGLEQLGEQRFDAAVSSMAIMDFDPLDPLLRAVHRALKPGGRFVFSIPHPCFNSNSPVMTAELEEHEGRLEHIYGVKVTRYKSEGWSYTRGLLHQPEPHYLMHRTFQTLFNVAFKAGFVLDGFEEPCFPWQQKGKNVFSWPKRPDIPPAVVVRLRPAAR